LHLQGQAHIERTHTVKTQSDTTSWYSQTTGDLISCIISEEGDPEYLRLLRVQKSVLLARSDIRASHARAEQNIEVHEKWLREVVLQTDRLWNSELSTLHAS
jgi:hypothetical protein